MKKVFFISIVLFLMNVNSFFPVFSYFGKFQIDKMQKK